VAPQSKAPTESELAALLGEIGTKRRSIAPAILEEDQYALILRECPYIAARLPPSAPNTTVGVIANQAIKLALDTLPSQTDQLVAEAALGIKPFEGQLIKERQRDVSSTPDIGCDEHAFRRRRERTLPFIARKLLQAEVATPRGRDRPRATEPMEARASRGLAVDSEALLDRSLQRLGGDAANLHFHCLAVLFLSGLHYSLPEDLRGRLYKYHYASSTIWDHLSEVSLRYALVPYLSGADFLRRYSQRRGVAPFEDRMGGPDYALLADLIQSIAEMNPLGSEQVRLLTSCYEGYLFEDEFPLGDILDQTWRPWFYRAIVRVSDDYRGTGMPQGDYIYDDPLRRPLPLEVLAARAGAIEKTITQHLSYPEPVVANARRRVHKLVSYVAEPDEFQPFVDGRSLRDLLDAYLDEHSVRLASSSTVWYKSE
jgi:hypothetical protein